MRQSQKTLELSTRSQTSACRGPGAVLSLGRDLHPRSLHSPAEEAEMGSD